MNSLINESYEKYRQLFDGSRDGLFIVDVNGKFMDCNLAYSKMIGYSLDELKKLKRFVSITPKKWRKWEDEEIWKKRLLKRGFSEVYEKEYIRKDGTIFPVEIQAYCVFDKNKKPIYLWGTARDITKKKTSEKKYQQIYSSMSEGLILHRMVYDKNGIAIDYKILNINLSGEKIIGLKAKDIVNKLASRVYKKRVPPYLEIYSRVAKTGKPESFETYYKPMGLYLRISVFSPRKDEFVTIFSDITESKKIENAIKESEKKFRSFLEINPDPVCICKINGNITYVNNALINLIRCKKNDIVGKNVVDIDFITDKSKQRIGKEIALFQRNKEFVRKYKIEVITRNKERRILEVNSADVFEDGKLDSWLISFRDLTNEEKEKEKINTERKQFLSMFDGMDEIVYVADPKTYEMLYMNPSAKRNWNWSSGRKCYEVLQNSKKPCSFCTNDKIFGENFGKTYTWEFRNLINKRWYKCIDRGIKWSDGRDVRFEMAIDITNQKDVEEKVKSNERFLKSILDNIPLIVFVKDSKDLRFEMINKAGEKFLGQKKENLIGKNDKDFFTKDQADFFTKKDLEVLNNGELVDIGDESIDTPKGKRILHTKKIPIIDNMGVSKHLLGISEDITEKKKIEEESQKLNKFTIDRELRMVELKKEINTLLKSLGKKSKYKIN